MSANEHRFIMHKGKEILYIDYRNLVKETFFDEIAKAHALIMTCGRNDLLQLVDITKSFGDNDVMEEMKRTAKESKPFIKKRAIIGVTGVKRVFLGVINAFTNEKTLSFDTLEEAMDYLVAE